MRARRSTTLPANALRELARLERRLSGPAHEILGVTAHASNSEACAAFVDLAREFHPRRFAEFDERVVRRAGLAHRALRAALLAFTRAKLASTPPPIAPDAPPADDLELDRATTRRFTPLRRTRTRRM